MEKNYFLFSSFLDYYCEDYQMLDKLWAYVSVKKLK